MNIGGDDGTATTERLIDGWVRARDIGRIDRNGYLSVLDRADDMIVPGGFNLWRRSSPIIRTSSGWPGSPSRTSGGGNPHGRLHGQRGGSATRTGPDTSGGFGGG